jgi:hypothetical protein
MGFEAFDPPSVEEEVNASAGVHWKDKLEQLKKLDEESRTLESEWRKDADEVGMPQESSAQAPPILVQGR